MSHKFSLTIVYLSSVCYFKTKKRINLNQKNLLLKQIDIYSEYLIKFTIKWNYMFEYKATSCLEGFPWLQL